MPATPIFYKYRSLENWQFLLDIVLTKRLYAAPFTSLNDPMEGQNYYLNGRVRGDVRSAIAASREQWNICSLTPDAKSTLMWAYYANGHKGIAIGVKLARLKKCDKRGSVDYDSQVYVRPDEANRSPEDVATTILFRKQSLWGHEHEFRVLTRDQHVAINIVQVHIGSMITQSDRQRVVKLIKLAVPTARIHNVSRDELH